MEELSRRKRITEDTRRELRKLTVPEYPECTGYLLRWARELDRTRWSSEGRQPFTYPMVESWARLTGRHPTPLEVEGLFQIDIAMRSPYTAKELDEMMAERGDNR